MPRLLLAIGVLALLPAGASAASYRATITGKQEVNWKVDGTTSACESRHGAGQGTSAFKFASTKPAPLARSGSNLVGSIPSKATGTIAGAFTDTVATACEGFEPSEAFTAPADGCGATKFGIRVDLTPKGAFVFVTGPEVPLGPVSLAQAGGECPSTATGGILDSNDFSGCGDGTQLWKRSWGVASSDGRGLLASKVHVTPKNLPKGKRKRTFSKHVTVDCTMPSQYSGGVKITGDLQYTITVKRA